MSLLCFHACARCIWEASLRNPADGLGGIIFLVAGPSLFSSFESFVCYFFVCLPCFVYSLFTFFVLFVCLLSCVCFSSSPSLRSFPLVLFFFHLSVVFRFLFSSVVLSSFLQVIWCAGFFFCLRSAFFVFIARFDASRRGKKRLNSSRDRNEGTYRSGGRGKKSLIKRPWT